MSTLISLLHATRARPAKAVAAYKRWHEMAHGYAPEIEHIFSTDFDDEDASGELHELMLEAAVHDDWTITANANKGSAEAWNNAYKASRGDLLIQVSDDMEPPEWWCSLLILTPSDHEWTEPLVIAVSDGYRKDRLLTTFICTRAYAEMEGHFICPDYVSVFSDDEVTYRAWKNAQEGRSKLIDARDLVFKHQHHYHDASVPWDATYARQNAPEAYAQGEYLFMQRNPEALKTVKEWKGVE